MSSELQREWQRLQAEHVQEAERIKGELDRLGPEFADDGIVRTILKERVEMELSAAELYSLITCDIG